MKHYYFISLWLIATVVSLLCTACHSNHPQIQAAYNLIERVTPGYGNQFQLELIDSENGKDVYEIGSQNGKVLLRGNNPVALATAYNQYFKIYLPCTCFLVRRSTQPAANAASPCRNDP